MSEVTYISTKPTGSDAVVEAVTLALTRVLDVELPDLTEDSKLFEELGLDSTGVFELLLQLEELLDIEFDTDSLQMSHFITVRTLADFVVAEQGAG
jgi:acyl carrier protein